MPSLVICNSTTRPTNHSAAKPGFDERRVEETLTVYSAYHEAANILQLVTNFENSKSRVGNYLYEFAGPHWW